MYMYISLGVHSAVRGWFIVLMAGRRDRLNFMFTLAAVATNVSIHSRSPSEGARTGIVTALGACRYVHY